MQHNPNSQIRHETGKFLMIKSNIMKKKPKLIKEVKITADFVWKKNYAFYNMLKQTAE